MKWSFSTAKIFSQCPKKWYYGAVFANPRSNDPERKEAYLLKHLQSVYAWRGKLVDQVITRFVVQKLNGHEKVDSDEVLACADRLMATQFAFAKAQLYRNSGVNDAKVSASDYCALFELEYGGSLDEDSIKLVGEEVRDSLTNLLDSRLMSEIAEDGLHLIAQRTLQFQFANVIVKSTPDLIAFFKNKPPAIIDWKVEAPKHKEHWLQLGVYAVSLSRVTPHKDFPLQWKSNLSDPTKIGLTEFQLLRNREVQYFPTQEDVIDTEDYIYTTSSRMQHMINNSNKPELLINLLPTTKSPEICVRCQFKKICWEEKRA